VYYFSTVCTDIVAQKSPAGQCAPANGQHPSANFEARITAAPLSNLNAAFSVPDEPKVTGTDALSPSRSVAASGFIGSRCRFTCTRIAKPFLNPSRFPQPRPTKEYPKESLTLVPFNANLNSTIQDLLPRGAFAGEPCCPPDSPLGKFDFYLVVFGAGQVALD
jgi:hypothetical protein